MKHLTTIKLLSLGLLLCLSSLAQTQSELADRQAADRKPPHNRSGNHQSRMLQHLLEMDDAQLDELGTTIQRIQGMSPEEKSAMKQRLKKLNKMPREEVEAMRERFQAIPPEQRTQMRQRWQEMSPEERHELRETLRSLPPEERRQFIQEKGIMPPRPKGPRVGGPGNGPKGQRLPQGTPSQPGSAAE